MENKKIVLNDWNGCESWQDVYYIIEVPLYVKIFNV